MSREIKVYLAQRMTGLYCDDLLRLALEATAKLERAGFTVLSPVIEEGVPNKHIKLVNTLGRLKLYWQRDKELLRESHIMLDLNSEGKSDGVNVEMGYTRFFLWKPLVRIHPNLGCTISRIEYDCVTDSLDKAVETMKHRWGTRHKLLIWRLKMLRRCIPKIVNMQIKFLLECI
jgi:hypothetical protein